MMNNPIPQAMNALRTVTSTTFNDYRIPSVRRQQIILTLVLTVVAFANGVGISEEATTANESMLELLAPLGMALVAGLAVALFWHALRVALTLSGPRKLLHEIRTSPRFAWFGLESLLLAVMYSAAAYSPLHMDFETWLWLYQQPWMSLINDFAFVGAPIAGLTLGGLAFLRPPLWVRLCGAGGVLAAAHALLERFEFTSLWEWAAWQLESLVFIFIGLPMSILYEMTSGDPVLGSTAILLVLIATWLVARRRILRTVASTARAHG